MMKMKYLATFFENLFDLVFGIPGVELVLARDFGGSISIF